MRIEKQGADRDRRHDAFEALAAVGQFGRNDWGSVGHLTADVGCDQADDALGLGAADPFAGVGASLGGAVDPELAVRIDHHFQHGGIGEGGGNGAAEGGLQHLPAAAVRFLGRERVNEVSHDCCHPHCWAWERGQPK